MIEPCSPFEALMTSNEKFTLFAIAVLPTTHHSLHLRQKGFLASDQVKNYEHI
jgi:hypothetical protein